MSTDSSPREAEVRTAKRWRTPVRPFKHAGLPTLIGAMILGISLALLLAAL